MSSILTNNSAMVALQTLKSVNSNLSEAQSQISTGMRISTAQDNAAIWAISQVMRSDVTGFQAISESLSLGSSTVAVARSASEQISDLLDEVKGRVVAAQEQNVDRAKIQTDIGELRNQINSIVNAAQFNGLNFLKGGGSVSILSSLDRSADGTVTASSISIAKSDLQVAQEAFGSTAVGSAGDLVTEDTTGGLITELGGADDAGVVTFTSGGATEGASYRVSITGVAGNDFGTTQVDYEYVARDGDTEADVAQAIYGQIDADLTARGVTGVSAAVDTSAGTITITNNDTTAANDLTLGIAENLGGTAGGGLAALGVIDVTTDQGATDALSSVETLIQTAIDAAAAFGSAQSRVDIQSDFVSNLMDSLKSGIGGLVDADMEAASARLQALQVQQQLGIQALSIANSQPQNILSLFR